MLEASEISPVFYKIGKLATSPKSHDLDSSWKIFESLELAINHQMDLLSGSLDRSFFQIPEFYQGATILENTQFQRFLESFGYNSKTVVLRKLSKDDFAILSDLEDTKVFEIFKWFDFALDLDSLNQRDRISVDTIIVASPKGKAIILAEPSTIGFLEYFSQASKRQSTCLQGYPVDLVNVPSLGAVSNPSSNQYAALDLLHEQGHLIQEDIRGYAAEVDASEYALAKLKALATQGINLAPRVQIEDGRRYLEEYLFVNAKRFHPFRTFFYTRVSGIRK